MKENADKKNLLQVEEYYCVSPWVATTGITWRKWPASGRCFKRYTHTHTSGALYGLDSTNNFSIIGHLLNPIVVFLDSLPATTIISISQTEPLSITTPRLWNE